MRNIFFFGMLLTAAFMAGWFKIQRDSEHTLIEIDRAAIRDDARQAIEKSREIIDRSEHTSGTAADAPAPWAPHSPWTAAPQPPYPPYSQAGYPTTSPYRPDSDYPQGSADRYRDYPTNQAPGYTPPPYTAPDYAPPSGVPYGDSSSRSPGYADRGYGGTSYPGTGYAVPDYSRPDYSRQGTPAAPVQYPGASAPSTHLPQYPQR